MSVRTTIVAAIAYVLLLAIVVLEVPLVINLSRRVDAEIRAEAAQQAQLISTSVEDRITGPPNRLQPVVDEAARALGGRVIVVDADGRVIVDSAGRELRGASYANRPEIARALGGETTQGERRSDTLDQDLLFTAVPVIEGVTEVGAVRVTQSVDAVNAEVRNDAFGLVGVGAAALLLGIGVAWILAGSLARPPRLLADAARRVAAGDLEARAPELGPREHREVARAFNEMTERLASVLSAQRDFVADASHQLRTPLTGLRLRLEAASDATGDPNVAEDLRAAEDEVVRLSRLIDNLLTLAREGQEPSAPGAVDLALAAEAAVERWEAEADGAGQRISLLASPSRAAALSSADDVGIILDNLLENAIKYGGEGSTVEIGWGRADPGTRDEVFLTVGDRGPGLAPGEERAALGRFYRGRAGAASSGTGLGLAIVDVLAQRWRGSVELANRAEGGLRVVVRFPAANDALRAADPDLTDSLPGPG
jgi:signal transduction histidine kinase